MRAWLGVVVLAVPVVTRAQAVLPAEDEPHGLTLEAGFGAGFVRTGGPYSSLDSVTFGGSAAVGFWLTPRTALTLRGALQTDRWVSSAGPVDWDVFVASSINVGYQLR